MGKFTLDPGAAVLTAARRPGLVERGIQPQPGDEGNGLSQGLAEVEQVHDGVAAVGHQHQGPVGQPPAQLEDDRRAQSVSFLGVRPLFR